MCANRSLGLLLLRLALAAVFISAGWEKIQNMPATVSAFGSMGFPAPLAYLTAWVEFLGGISLLLGFWTCVSGSLLAIVMLVATYVLKVKVGAGFSGPGGYEFTLTLLAATLCVVFAGPGRYALARGCCGGKCMVGGECKPCGECKPGEKCEPCESGGKNCCGMNCESGEKK
ncbi:MAG: hypothetical protein A2946_02545 [Candidatus Liptonbacteria bacterium RIFCSPLOWO2_01_FULL_53_13]|uniref:DoxX family protein n=1 Tax=Candidatus Liptonbacteria bacterium RIFCSPLOWO2_01_FULL_53_13 TaxID=1798651 RepID=A0A1G2CPH1_9BACT|nr:MAG: hypothetical protein A2946_02545 [Candidatus Liptonbacteria bacterium RIFCSPLOWO2_01_FULL_53_13]